MDVLNMSNEIAGGLRFEYLNFKQFVITKYRRSENAIDVIREEIVSLGEKMKKGEEIGGEFDEEIKIKKRRIEQIQEKLKLKPSNEKILIKLLKGMNERMEKLKREKEEKK